MLPPTTIDLKQQGRIALSEAKFPIQGEALKNRRTETADSCYTSGLGLSMCLRSPHCLLKP